MNIKKIKKLIIIGMVVIVVFILLRARVLNSKKKSNDVQETDPEAQYDDDRIDYSRVGKEKVADNMNFYTIAECVQQYIDVANINNENYYGYDDDANYIKVIEEKDIKQRVYNMLSEKYKTENEINVDNVFDYIDKIEENLIFIPVEIYQLKGENSNKYIVYGFVEDTLYNYKKDLYLFVNQDDKNSTFSIEPILNRREEDIENIEINNENELIESNGDNEYSNAELSDIYIVKQYFNRYKSMSLAKPNLAYEYLNKGYRERRFKNYSGFNNYIEDNREKIYKTDIEKYLTNIDGTDVSYVCLDQDKRYYIFNEKNGVDFEVILDTYTLDTKDFLKKYQSADNKTKSGMNIQRFFEALNNKDYDYAYERLADSFKNNYFNGKDSFKKFVEQHLFENNYITFNSYNEEGDLSVFQITNSDSKENVNSKNMTIVVKLEETTDYVLSFNIE